MQTKYCNYNKVVNYRNILTYASLYLFYSLEKFVELHFINNIISNLRIIVAIDLYSIVFYIVAYYYLLLSINLSARYIFLYLSKIVLQILLFELLSTNISIVCKSLKDIVL